MVTDKLRLNDNKTEFLIFGTKQQLSKTSRCHLTIASATVSPVNSARILELGWVGALPSKIILTKRVVVLTFTYTTSGTSERSNKGNYPNIGALPRY